MNVKYVTNHGLYIKMWDNNLIVIQYVNNSAVLAAGFLGFPGTEEMRVFFPQLTMVI